MAKVPTSGFTPGAQQPSKYIKVGPNYLKWGEQPGYYYVPQTDQYYIDQKQLNQQLQDQGVIDKPPGKPSLGEAIAPVAGAAAALYGGKYIGEHAGDWISSIGSKGGGLFSSGGTSAANTAANAATNSGLFSAGEVGGEAAFPVGSAANGGTLMSDGSIAGGPWFGSGGSMFNTEGMIGPNGSFAPLNVAGAALGTYGVYQASKAQNKREGVMKGAASGAAAGTSIAPGIGTVIGAIIGGLSGLAAHETTKHRTMRRFGELGKNATSKDFRALVEQGAQESLAGNDTWDLGDDKSAAPIELMTRSYGVLKTYGPQWLSISQDKRNEIVKQLVDHDLLNSKQGDYLIDDPQGAQDIFNAVLHPGNAALNSIQSTPQPQYTNPIPRYTGQQPIGIGPESAGGVALAPGAKWGPNGIASLPNMQGPIDPGFVMTMPMPLPSKNNNDPNYQQIKPKSPGKKPLGMLGFNKG